MLISSVIIRRDKIILKEIYFGTNVLKSNIGTNIFWNKCFVEQKVATRMTLSWMTFLSS